MACLDTIYVFVPDISIFRDAFNLTQETPNQKSARDFLNFLAKQSEESGGFKFLRCPGEFLVKLLNDPLFNNTKIWGFLGLILRYGDVSDKNIKTEEEIVKCYNHLRTYKKPILVSNDSKKEYKECDPLTTSQIMQLLPTIMGDNSQIDRKN
ncbi:MAG: hypothetical protein AABX28_03510 [Nanoarchaeota archaeon]